jgi:hypothetical protein
MNEPKEILFCSLCGEDLKPLEHSIETICDLCHNKAIESYSCSNGHIICDDCLRTDVILHVRNACLNYKGVDPLELAIEIMNSPTVKMHGPEHHFIAPAVIATCVYNLQNRHAELSAKLHIIASRAFIETSHVCKFEENLCGSACGMGVFLSVFQDKDLIDEDEWSCSNDITIDCLKEIENAKGPRCCKRDTYLSIQASIKYLKEKFAIELPFSDAKCTFSLRNKSCGHENCSFYNLSNSIV